MSDALLRIRAEFPALETNTYLISHSLGAMPRRAYAALKEYADAWARDGILAWERWFPMVRENGDRIGRLIGAPPGHIIIHQNVSTLLSIVLSCFDFLKRDTVVSTDMTFSTNHYNLLARRDRGMFKLRVAESPDGIRMDTQRVVDLIDERVQLVLLDLVMFRSGGLIDVPAIVRAAHAKGALVLVDAYQGVGTVPVDVRAWDVDMLTGGSVKWLCGGPGSAYLYVRPELVATLEPFANGWISQKRPFAFDMSRVEYADDVHRFLGGTPSIPALYASRSGYEIVGEIGVAAIREKSLRQTQWLMDLADEQGLAVNTPRAASERGGMVCVDFDGAEAVSKELLARRFLIDYRPKCGIRISPHFYTTDDELSAVMAQIRELR